MDEPVPGDVILDILRRLPTKTLVRLKLLSKHWCSHISTYPRVASLNPSSAAKHRKALFLIGIGVEEVKEKFPEEYELWTKEIESWLKKP
ncbi:hypothetical protein CCACVL1_27186 [Corchorus capsularis]|uniref:F-box domain-containing protein n=1 Tax=Corchorus capsularis TaxID=210143 RepID=A0A1R3GC18_COCAP|nr:hypothetical protein CCACVL1_27186 [Corchorus capsularis]